MNQRTKEFIVAVQDHTAVYGNTSISAFVEGMRGLEPEFMARQTLTDKLDKGDFAFYVSPIGKVYEIYRYENPNYKPQSKSNNEGDVNGA